MYKGKTVLAVIPARKGSVRFPDKNLAEINGRTLVELAVEVAIACPFVDQIVVTSNDKRAYTPLIELSNALWLDRPKSLSQGEAGSSQRTWRHAWQKEFEYSLLLEPTSPNRTVADINRCLASLHDSDFKTVATVSIQDKLFTLRDRGAELLNKSVFKMNGICYASKDREADLFSDCLFIPIARRVANIDYPEDLDLARFLFGMD